MRFLRITLLAGLILLFLSGTVFTVFFFIERSTTRVSRQQESFYRLLQEYDSAARESSGTERGIEQLHRELDRLERRTITVESWLSILKRRRALANIHPPSMVNYRNSIDSALKAFPYSQPIAAIAAAALVKDSGINMEIEEQLRQWLNHINDSHFNSLRLALHVILGDFRNPESAAALPADLLSDSTEAISINLAILKILRGDYRAAAADIQALINSPSPTANALRFAAEYHFDFGDLLRSAEIFSLLYSFLRDESALSRQADALYLAGFTEIAASIWFMLAELQNETGLYNLALVAESRNEAAAFLERLVNMDSDSKARQFGIIRYSRLLDYSQAVLLLQNTVNLSPLNYPYIDLEIIKRHAQDLGLGRQLAETWLLLDRHERNEELYKWAAWLFFFQQRFDEARILLNRMELQQINAQWIDVYRAILLMIEGNLDAAENILRVITEGDAPWYVHANLGRILETARSPGRALEQYQKAAELMSETPLQAQNLRSAARIQIQIARCQIVLNRPIEALMALQYALELDPENLTARLELDRLF
jgi:tetratricopeptide (TPR) repeat protein